MASSDKNAGWYHMLSPKILFEDLRASCAGNNCHLLTITKFDSDPREIAQRKGIVFSARVHPGLAGF